MEKDLWNDLRENPVNQKDNGRSPMNDEKGIKYLLQWEDYDIEYTPLDPEEEGFGLGLLEENGLITHDLKVTPAGWKEVVEILREQIAEGQANESNEDQENNDDEV